MAALRPGDGGRGYGEILATYYRGAEMGSAPDTLLKQVRVIIAAGLADAR